MCDSCGNSERVMYTNQVPNDYQTSGNGAYQTIGSDYLSGTNIDAYKR